MRINNLIQTCGACPSQWEGSLPDGRMVYIRYRYGVLRVSVSPTPTENPMEAVAGKVVFTEQIGEALAGVLSTEEMLELIKDVTYE